MRVKTWTGFAALCVISASTWVEIDYIPPVLVGMIRQAVHSGLLCVGCVLFIAIRKYPERPQMSAAIRMRVGAWAAVLFCLPTFCFAAAAGKVGVFSGVLVFTFVPAFTVFLQAQKFSDLRQSGDPLKDFGPALAGVGGAAMLIPFGLPSSVGGWWWLAATGGVAIVAAMAAVELHRHLAGFDLVRAAALVSGCSSLVAGLLSLVGWTRFPELTAHGIFAEIIVCFVIDGPILLFTVWMLRDLPATAFSARYLLIPLLTIAEGFLLIRPSPHWMMLFGALAMVYACGVLLRTNEEDTLRA